MAPRKIEWAIALKDAGVKKTVKGIDRELAAMEKTFEDLNRIKAFSKSQQELKKLESSLATAKSKAAALYKEAESGGKRQQNAYNKAAAAVKTLEQAVRKQTGAVAKQSAAIKKAGGTTRNLTQTQKELSEAFRASSVDAKKAGQAAAASATLGIKLNRKYRDEIAAQRKARRELAASGKASATDLARADKAVADNIARIKREMRGVKESSASAASGIGKLAGSLIALAAAKAAVQKILAGFAEVTTFANEQEQQEAKLAAVVKATGEAAGFSADEIKKYAGELQGATTFGDELTISAAAILATFKQIKGDEFKRTIAAAQDLSSLLGTDLKSSVLQLGKALEDPTTGLTALRRAGVSFSASEKERIKTLQESGKIQEAQRIVLKAVEDQVGGTANALRKQYGGAVTAVDNAYGDLKEEIGFFITKNKDVVAGVGDVERGIVSLTGKIAEYREPVSEVVGDLVKFSVKNKELVGGLGLVAAGFGTATAAITLYNTGLGAAVAANAAAAASAVASAAALAAPYAVIAAGVVSVVVAIDKYNEMREAQKETAAAAGRAADQEEKYQDRLKRAGQATGLTIKSYKDVQAAYKAGALDYDALTDTYSKGSGIARKAADVQVNAAKDVSAAAAGTADAVKESVEVQEISLKEAQKEWDSYAQKIREIDQQIAAIGNYGGGGTLQGLQQINGEWQFFTTNAQKAASAMQDFQFSALGTGEVADKIFELSLAGKSDIEVWNARKQAAEQYAQAARQLTADAKMFAAAGDLDTANKKFAQAAEVARKSEGMYKSLATTVKAEWTPAMEAAHKTAKEGVKKYGEMASEWLYDVEQHYGRARSAAQQLADRQLDLEERMLRIKTAGQAPAEAYRTMAAQAKKYEEAARAALAAGDFDRAVAMADRATSAWDSLGNEVKDGEQTVVSAQQAIADQAAGVQAAGQVAIDALKAQEQAELKAAAAAEEKAKKATAAKEKEAAKVKALEAEKEKALVSAEQGAQAAAAGTLQANQQIVDILETQKTVIGEVADALNKQADWQLGDTFTDAGTAAKGLGDIVKYTAEDMTKALDAFRRSGEASIDALESRLDAMVAEKRVVTVEVREVSASASGSITGAARAATGNIFMGRSWSNVKQGRINPGGPSMVDNIPVITAAGETITKASSAKKIGYNVWRPYNAGDPVGMAKALASNHPQVREVFTPRIRVTPALKVVSAPALPASGGGGQLPDNLIHITVNDYVDGVSYDKYMTPGSLDLEQAREQRRQNIKKVVQR